MPKGLKLDSAFPELRILERLGSRVRPGSIRALRRRWGALARAHLASSSMAHGVVATPGGAILGTTAAMERLLGNESRPLNGQPLWEFLTPESAKEVRSRVATGSRRYALRFSMTFIGAGSSEHLLICNGKSARKFAVKRALFALRRAENLRRHVGVSRLIP